MSKRTTGAAKADPGQYLPALARAAADRVRAPKTPLTRRQALAAAPWDPSMPPVWERAFRAAYADRLEELGIALPAARSGKSGLSGESVLERATLRQTPEEFRAQRALAAAQGVPWSTWVRRKLAT